MEPAFRQSPLLKCPVVGLFHPKSEQPERHIVLRPCRAWRTAKPCGLDVAQSSHTHRFPVRRPNPHQQPSPLRRGCHAVGRPNSNQQPSPLGRGCHAAGVFISRSVTGEGSVGTKLVQIGLLVGAARLPTKLVPRRGTTSLAVGETYGFQTRIPATSEGSERSTPAGSGPAFRASGIRRFHLRLMMFIPFGDEGGRRGATRSLHELL